MTSRSALHLAVGALALLGTVTAPTPVAAAPVEERAAAFAITAPAVNSLFTGLVLVEGTKDAAGTVEVQAGDALCSIPTGDQSWSCELNLPDGRWDVTAVQSLGGVESTATTAVRVLGAPTIDGPDPLLTAGRISGRGFPGAGIAIVGSGPQNPSGFCAVVQPSGFWTCELTTSVSGDYSVTVQHRWPETDEAGGVSAARSVTLDRDAPAAPLFASPNAGQRVDPGTVTFSGTGEPGGRVDVLLGGTIVCSAAVLGGWWSCSGAVPVGDWSVQAVARDAAGNPSRASAAFSIAARPAPDQPAPVAPVRPAPPTPDLPPPPPSEPAPDVAAPPRVAPGVPFFPPPVGGVSGLPPLQTWGTPTDYGASIPSIRSAPWALGVLIGIGYLALVAVPLRMLRSALHGRFRARPQSDEPPLLRPWVTAALALAGAVVLAALAGGIQAEVRYLRLAISIGIALLTLNLIGVLIASRVAGWVLAVQTGLRLAPVLLGIGAIAAIVSRIGGVQPPVIVGVVLAATAIAAPRPRGILAIAEVGTITLLGLFAWIAHSVIGPVDGLWQSLASETLAALCIAALSSAAVLLIPVGRMPGRAIWDWSRPAWVAAALPSALLAGVVLGGGTTFHVLPVTAAGLALATVCISALVWVRYVEPLTQIRSHHRVHDPLEPDSGLPPEQLARQRRVPAQLRRIT